MSLVFQDLFVYFGLVNVELLLLELGKALIWQFSTHIICLLLRSPLVALLPGSSQIELLDELLDLAHNFFFDSSLEFFIQSALDFLVDVGVNLQFQVLLSQNIL